MAKNRKLKDRFANKPGYWMDTMYGPRPRHVVNPPGSKLIRSIARRRS